eukprot:Mrub_01832.p1 GENE.Mrub_01832~~Mrub_01832.p1  ORF type:complete len:608 (-),score=58.47 Mrub_01832:133-1728(-)
MDKRLSGVGLASIFTVFIIYVYYATLLAYILKMIIESISDSSQFNNADFLMGKIVGLSTGDDRYNMNWDNLGYTAATMLICYVTTVKGAKYLSYFVYFSMPVPVILLIVLAIRGLMLEGSGAGISVYLTGVSGAKFDSTIIPVAIGQCFFSLSVCMGVMTAYSYHNEENKSTVVLDEKIIGLSDMGIAFVAGFSIYSFLGYKVTKCINDGGDIATCEEAYTAGGFGLAFNTYPVILNDIGQVWVILFLVTLYLLGIDSCLSMLDAAKMGVMDFKWGQRLFGGSYELCNTVLVVLGLLIAVPCNFKFGLILWDRWDFYLNNWGLLVIAFLEVLSVSYFYKRDERIESIGSTACNILDFGLILSMVISAFIFVFVDFSTVWLRIAVYLAILLGLWIVSYFAASATMKEGGEMTKGLSINGYESLMQEVNGWSEGGENKDAQFFEFNPNKMDSLMGWTLKYFTPTCLILAFAQNTKSLSDDLAANTLEVEIYGYVFLVIMALIIITISISPLSTKDDEQVFPVPVNESKADITV